MWYEMEKASVCPGRSALSMRNRWRRHILPRLVDFGVTAEQLEEADDLAAVRRAEEVSRSDCSPK